MNRDTLFYKLFMGNLVIVALVVAVAGAVSYVSLKAVLLHEIESYEDHMAVMARECIERHWPMPDAQVDRLCKRLVEEPAIEDASGRRQPPWGGLPIRMTVIAADGRVLGDSHGDPARMENHKTADRPEVLAALAGRPGSQSHRSGTLGAEYRYVALPLRHDGQTAGAIRVAVPVVAIVQNQAVIRNVLAAAALAILAAFALIALLVNWTWYRPLRRIAEAADQVASGDLARRVPVSGSGELARLALALNEMRDGLADKIATITAQRENLATVFASLRDAVIALDADGQVLLANDAAKQLLAPEGQPLSGRHLQTLVRAVGIIDAYHESVSTGGPVTRQVDAGVKGLPRHLDVLVAPMAAAERGAARLVVVRDVTDLVRAAAMKAEFVANASHELRTPMASLRAAADSLADVGPADREDLARLTEVIDRQVWRLEALTQDLLELHRVESAKGPPSLELVAPASLVEWLRAQFGGRADAKGVALALAAPAPDDAFLCDRHLLELILQNLVDNAVKFTPSGGRVTCSIERDGRATRLRVSDTGCGIRREDQPRVFERFFQADASRSGDPRTRGTGLGLAIVKHACERLGGTVSLQSEPGHGTTVTVVIPDQTQR